MALYSHIFLTHEIFSGVVDLRGKLGQHNLLSLHRPFIPIDPPPQAAEPTPRPLMMELNRKAP